MKRLRLALVVLVVLLLGGVLFLWIDFTWQRKAFHAYVAELGINEEDWRPRAAPAADNAFPLVEAIVADLEEAGLGNVPWEWDLDREGNPEPGEWPAIESWVEAVRPYLVRLRAASNLPGYADTQPRQTVMERAFEPFGHLVTLERLVQWSCRVAEREQQRAEASVGDVAMLLRLVAQADWGGMHMVSIGSQVAAVACDQIPRLARMEAFDAADARRQLDPWIVTLLDPQRFPDRLRSKQLVTIAAVWWHETGTSSEEGADPPEPLNLWGGGFFYREARFILEDLEGVRQRIREVGLRSSIPEMALRSEADELMVRMSAEDHHHTVGRLRLARILLALHAHRQARGAFPESLSELAPLFPDGIPLDPATEKPFSYERGVKIGAAGDPRTDMSLR
ncbi:MAG: hypothetical protein AAGD14_03745 [Planctomycetota bacterium]